MLKSTIKTEVRIHPDGFEVWYSVDGGQSSKFHSSYESFEEAIKETMILKGHYKLLGDLKTN